MKHFWPKIEVWASDLVLEPLNTMGMVISMLFDLFEMFSQGINHFYLLPGIFMADLAELEWPLKFRPPVTKSKMLLDGPVKVFQLKLFIPSFVGSMEGLNIPKAQNFSMCHSWVISCRPFSVRPSQKVSISYLKTAEISPYLHLSDDFLILIYRWYTTKHYSNQKYAWVCEMMNLKEA